MLKFEHETVCLLLRPGTPQPEEAQSSVFGDPKSESESKLPNFEKPELESEYVNSEKLEHEFSATLYWAGVGVESVGVGCFEDPKSESKSTNFQKTESESNHSR